MTANIIEKKTVEERVAEYKAKRAKRRKLASEIWTLHLRGVPTELIAEKFGIHVATIKSIYSQWVKALAEADMRTYAKIKASNFNPTADSDKIQHIRNEMIEEELDRFF